MKTSSWLTIGSTPGRIGISLGSPRGAPGGYRLYKALAPTRDMLSLEDIQAYAPRYAEILAGLDPQKVWDDVHKLAGVDASGVQIEPILLCFERPPLDDKNFCHRRMAADWFEKHLGHRVPELGYEQAGLALA